MTAEWVVEGKKEAASAPPRSRLSVSSAMRPAAAAAAQRAVVSTPPNEKKCAAMSPSRPLLPASASARTIASGAEPPNMMLHQSGLARSARGRRLHAAARGVAQQGRDAGRAGHADAHGIFDAEIAQPPDPAEDGLRIETELRDDLDRTVRFAAPPRSCSRASGRASPPECAHDRRDARRCRCRRCRGAAEARFRSLRSSLRTGPADASLSPAITSTWLTCASPFNRASRPESAAGEANLRAARCGTGSKPAARTALAYPITSSTGLPATALR